MSAAREPRVLLSAYQCAPGLGSVSQIGWEWYRRLAERVPVTLFTHVRNRAVLEAAGAPLAGSEVAWIDTEWLAGPLYRLARRAFPEGEHAVFLVSSLDFFPFDALVVREARRRVRSGARFDVAHQVTPVSPAAPTRLHRVGVPVVLGPWNGGLSDPEAFPEVMRRESRWLRPLRGLARALDAAFGSTRSAAAILTATRATLEAVPARHRHLCVPLLENGVDPHRFPEAPWPEPPSADEPLRVLFVGRLVAVKGLPMLLDAVARLRGERPVALTVVGDGPLRAEWVRRATDLGLGDAVRFLGARSLDEVAAEMRRCHVLCLPSVRESGGAVLLEAMATARPVIAIAHGGPAEIVDESVGRAIAPRGAAFVTGELATCLRDVAARPDVWREKGEEGRRVVVARHSWDAKIDAALALYRRVRADAPHAAAARGERTRALGSGA